MYSGQSTIESLLPPREMVIDGKTVDIDTGEVKVPLLRDYQERAVVEARATIESGLKKILLVLPTGAGKSWILAEIIRLAAEKSARVLFLVHRRNLVLQIRETLKMFGVDAGVIMAGIDSDLVKKVQIGTYQTYQRRIQLEGGRFFVDADLILIDEAHRSISQGYLDILSLYSGKVIIGTTATPMRSDGRPLGTIYDKIVDVIGVKELTDRGFLAKARYFSSPIDIGEVKISKGDYDVKELDKKTNTKKLVGDIVENWLRIAQNRPTIVFCVTVRHSISVCEEFRLNGILAVHLDARSTDEEREDAFRKMVSGEITVLCNVALYQEGMDCPNISCVVMGRPTKSLGLYRQCAGRGLRPDKKYEDCLSRGTFILTNKGNIKIEDITLDHRLWDGVSYIEHGGIICKGVREVISYQGLTATKKHMVMTNEGWKEFSEAANRQIRIIESGDGGKAIRIDDNSISKNRREMGSAKSSRKVFKVRGRIYEHVPQYEEKTKDESLPKLQLKEQKNSPYVVVPKSSNAERQMREQKKQKILGLWREGDKIRVQICTRCNCLDIRKFGLTRDNKKSTRSYREFWKLCTRESKMEHASGEYGKFKKNIEGDQDKVYVSKKGLRTYKICGCNNNKLSRARNDRRPNIREMGQKAKQEEVWDIINAGPLQRFTANGLLVHNCIILDHGGVIEEHGLLTDEVEWALDGKEKAYTKAKKKETDQKVVKCSSCNAVFEGMKVCPDCGTELKTFGVKVDTEEADLQEVKGKKKATTAEKRQYLGMLKYWVHVKGYSPKMITAKYKSRYDCWIHHSLKNTAPIAPDRAFLNLMQHDMIKYAKRRKQ